MSKDFLSLIVSKAGIALESIGLDETDFSSVDGLVYLPPERGVFRRVNSSRTIQILQDGSGVIITTQTSSATIRLPSGLIVSNDASDGRIFYVLNNGTGTINIEGHVGSLIGSIVPDQLAFIIHSENDDWILRLIGEGGINPLGSIYQFIFGYNGTPVNRWLNHYVSGIPSNQTPAIVPWNSKLVSVTFSNRDSGIGSYIEGWVSALGDGLIKTRFLNWHIDKFRVKYKNNFTPDIYFDAGDKISCYHEDVGVSTKDVIVIFHLMVIASNTDEDGENYSGDCGGGGTS